MRSLVRAGVVPPNASGACIRGDAGCSNRQALELAQHRYSNSKEKNGTDARQAVPTVNRQRYTSIHAPRLTTYDYYSNVRSGAKPVAPAPPVDDIICASVTVTVDGQYAGQPKPKASASARRQ